MTYEKVYLKKKNCRLILYKLLLTMKRELNHQVQLGPLLAKEQMQVKFVLTWAFS